MKLRQIKRKHVERLRGRLLLQRLMERIGQRVSEVLDQAVARVVARELQVWVDIFRICADGVAEFVDRRCADMEVGGANQA